MNADRLPLELLAALAVLAWLGYLALRLLEAQRDRTDDAHARVTRAHMLTQSVQHGVAHHEVEREEADRHAHEVADKEPESIVRHGRSVA